MAKIDTDSITSQQLSDWRERLDTMPEFTETEKRKIAWEYGNSWPAIAALRYFPEEIRVAR